MKKKKEMKKSQVPLGKEVRLGKESFSFGTVEKIRFSGKINGESTVSYSFCLPEFENPKTNDYFSHLRDAFFSFLTRAGETPSDKVLFGGLDWYGEEDRLILLGSFCPFEERHYRKVGTFTLSPQGEILKIRKEK
jgi:hypothetical protein